MTFYKTALTGALLLLLTGCAGGTKTPSNIAQSCAIGDTMTQSTLYFGLNRPAGPEITTTEWQQFVDNDVTPSFREGLTVFNASGQWLGKDGKLARESSKALMLIHAGDAESNSNIEKLRSTYQSRFNQDSVMRVDQKVCVAF
ncbi:DUF3574 domain-containing protein [Klebsiella sp. BIGb0407]|uniref:DUF3574 domain-containing protein n=1 Tax=Klebsiella sp. BIGb0407 TaxID=2940603 RepID=UPI002169A5B8|nr:DUF3574 domain-containing protein [Klebsiella sp. BIGb0407]MCS3433451.1 hypothetical protein [Klebsiella sp. BIGb0407]